MKSRTVPADRSHTLDAFDELHVAWLTSLQERNYSAISIRAFRYDGRVFFTFLRERGITQPHEVTLPVLNRYRAHLFAWRSDNPRDKGKPLSWGTQYKRLLLVKVFYRWLTKERHILYDPSLDLELPRIRYQLPKDILTRDEMELMLAQPDVAKPLGVRDRAILEVMYSTGCRRTELTKVAISDVDYNRGMMRIRFAKGGKERTTPLGERALAWIDKYLKEVRPRLLAGAQDEALFLSQRHKVLTPKELTNVVTKHMRAALPNKSSYGCHLIRHTTATVMLDAGADTRHIQELLGHADLKSTQIYTRVTHVNLKAIHNRFHPAAKLTSKRQAASEAEDEEP